MSLPVVPASALAQTVPSLHPQAAVPAPGSVEVAGMSRSVPTAADAAAFDAARRAVAPAEIQAAAPTSTRGFGGGLLGQVEALGRQLGALREALPEAAPRSSADLAPATHPGSGSEAGLASDRDAMQGAVSQMERAYVVAIETTMASRGSTETTKIFNTLLKGQ